jgi:hypothetical protein
MQSDALSYEVYPWKFPENSPHIFLYFLLHSLSKLHDPCKKNKMKLYYLFSRYVGSWGIGRSVRLSANDHIHAAGPEDAEQRKTRKINIFTSS